ncbi:MAG: hypothetical protein WDZ49_13990 [Litorilinea sp.]
MHFIMTCKPDSHLTLDEEIGERLYRNALITSHILADDTLIPLITAGRTRWKIENENNNVLKNYGYHLAHNYGHSKQYLSTILVMLNLLAFLFHTILDLTDRRHQLIRQEFGIRKPFFQDIQALTRYLYFDSWNSLHSFMFQQLELSLSHLTEPKFRTAGITQLEQSLGMRCGGRHSSPACDFTRHSNT